MGLLDRLKEKAKSSIDDYREERRIYREEFKKAKPEAIRARARREARERFSKRRELRVPIGIGFGQPPRPKKRKSKKKRRTYVGAWY